MAIGREPGPNQTPPDAEKFIPAKQAGLLARVQPEFKLTIQKIFPLAKPTVVGGESTLQHDRASQVNPATVLEKERRLRDVNGILREQGLDPVTEL